MSLSNAVTGGEYNCDFKSIAHLRKSLVESGLKEEDVDFLEKIFKDIGGFIESLLSDNGVDIYFIIAMMNRLDSDFSSCLCNDRYNFSERYSELMEGISYWGSLFKNRENDGERISESVSKSISNFLTQKVDEICYFCENKGINVSRDGKKGLAVQYRSPPQPSQHITPAEMSVLMEEMAMREKEERKMEEFRSIFSMLYQDQDMYGTTPPAPASRVRLDTAPVKIPDTPEARQFLSKYGDSGENNPVVEALVKGESKGESCCIQ